MKKVILAKEGYIKLTRQTLYEFFKKKFNNEIFVYYNDTTDKEKGYVKLDNPTFDEKGEITKDSPFRFFYFSNKDMGNRYIRKKYDINAWINADDIDYDGDRDDVDLINILENQGIENSINIYFPISIIEIPDDMEYYITYVDNKGEFLHEKHRVYNIDGLVE